jgi:hypothetical protein
MGTGKGKEKESPGGAKEIQPGELFKVEFLSPLRGFNLLITALTPTACAMGYILSPLAGLL